MPSLQFSTSSIEVNILWHIIQQINIFVNFITPALYILIREINDDDDDDDDDDGDDCLIWFQFVGL